MSGEYIKLAASSPFPVVQRLEQFKPHVEAKEEIRFMTGPNGMVTCSYVVSADGTFDTNYLRECRGIVFNAKGVIAARPLHKFFNVNEKPTTHVDALDWSKVTRIMDKRDGSMIHTVALLDNEEAWDPRACVELKSKKSFTSDVALAAKAWLTADEDRFDRYSKLCQTVVYMLNSTAIFEFTSPTARIVLPYNEPMLCLLHVRNNVTGEYMSYSAVKQLCELYKVPIVESVWPNEAATSDPAAFVQGLIAQAQDESYENREGWVIQFENGEMVKLKTKWYMLRHRAMTFLRERDVAELVLDEGLDDLKAMLVADNVDITPLLHIEARVVARIEHILSTVDAAVTAAKQVGLSKKDFAISSQGKEYFGLMMTAFDGREVQVKDYFKKQLLREEYSLEQINLLNSVAEAE